MSDAYSSSNALDPEAGFTRPAGSAPSVGQAAHDLRAAATEKAREFASATAEQAAEKATQFKQVATDKVETFRNAATEKAQHLRETAVEQWHDTRDKAKELHVTAEDYIRQHPTKTVLSALGIGFLIGLIVRR